MRLINFFLQCPKIGCANKVVDYICFLLNRKTLESQRSIWVKHLLNFIWSIYMVFSPRSVFSNIFSPIVWLWIQFSYCMRDKHFIFCSYFLYLVFLARMPLLCFLFCSRTMPRFILCWSPFFALPGTRLPTFLNIRVFIFFRASALPPLSLSLALSCYVSRSWRIFHMK